jgi:hypothetical protein
VPISGVAAIETRGKADTWSAALGSVTQPEPPAADERAAKLAVFKAIEHDSGMSHYDYFCEGWERARASSPNAAQAAEPVAWQYRPVINGKPYPWIECTKEAAERLRNDDYRETHEVRDLYAALPPPAPAQASEAVAIPVGYALVPIEPTPEILTAIWQNERDSRRAWERALAAVSAPPAEAWRDLLDAVTREVDGGKYQLPWTEPENAPGHAHKVPGIWDSDNGARAGMPCALCLTWNNARQALAHGNSTSPSAEG